MASASFWGGTSPHLSPAGAAATKVTLTKAPLTRPPDISPPAGLGEGRGEGLQKLLKNARFFTIPIWFLSESEAREAAIQVMPLGADLSI
jgi:hypothetical protein